MKRYNFITLFLQNGKEWPLLKRKKIGVSVLFFLLFFIVLFCYFLFDFPYLRLRYAQIQEGMIADFDLILKEDLSFVDDQATALRKAEAKEQISPIYLMDSAVTKRAGERFLLLWKLITEAQEQNSSLEDFQERLEKEKFTLDEPFWQLWREKKISHNLFEVANRSILYLIHNGIVKLNQKDLGREVMIMKRDRREVLVREEVDGASVTTLENYDEKLRKQLSLRQVSGDDIQLISVLLKSVIQENVFYSPRATAQAIAKAEAEGSPIIFSFKKGEPLLRKGYPITAAQISAIEYLKRIAIHIDLSTVISILLYLLTLFVISGFLLRPPFIKKNLQLNQLILLLLLMLFLTIFYICWKELTPLDERYFVGLFLPIGFIAFLIGVFISTTAIVWMIILSLLGFLLFFNASSMTLIFSAVSGLAVAFSLNRVAQRIDILKAGVKVMVFQGVAILAISPLFSVSPLQTLIYFFIAIGNGAFSSLMALGTIPLLEMVFNFVTPFRLMELTDRNLPIFRKMEAMAPGTYSHTLAVANYAEAAAREIGANSLLARCGAYYHDIGKIDQPEFFAENQIGYNKHDEIQPNLSIVVIKSHVVNGVNKAKAIGLPQEVVDIIEQHHGNSVINYFYVQAIRQGKSIPTEEDYSYKTPLPQSKEAGIVMIADVMEAAVRSLGSPVTIAQVERFIDRIISDKIDNNQFVESQLTFSDVNRIKATILRLVCGQLHTRPEYPDKNLAVKEKSNESN